MIDKVCEHCASLFKTWPCRIKVGKKFCSLACKTANQIGKNNGPFQRGHKIKVPKEARKRQADKMRNYRDEKCWNWKGDKAKYGAIHDWVTRHLGRPSSHKCLHCKDKPAYDWANVDHKYRRLLQEYMPLCRKCHYSFDIRNGLRKFNHFCK